MVSFQVASRWPKEFIYNREQLICGCGQFLSLQWRFKRFKQSSLVFHLSSSHSHISQLVKISFPFWFIIDPYLAWYGGLFCYSQYISETLTLIFNLIYEVISKWDYKLSTAQSALLCWFQFQASSGNFSIVTELLLHLPY